MSETWDLAYREKSPSERSWIQEMPTESLELIELADIGPDDPVIDVGGGSSGFVDALISRHYEDVTVLDLSLAALEEVRGRIEANFKGSSGVHLINENVLDWDPERTYGLWHDRAVFHFLVESADRDRYLSRVERSVRPGGHLIVATFAPDGPETCSGLPVARWSADSLEQFFSAKFVSVADFNRVHRTPWGAIQPFVWILMQRGDV